MNDDNVALFDLDGSLAGYEERLARDLKLVASPNEPNCSIWADHPYLRERIRLIRNQPGWWEDLPVIQKGLDVFHEARRIGFSCQVLTKGPVHAVNAWTEKVKWCQRHLGLDVPVHIVTDKGLVYGKVLYDDFPDYMKRWLRFRPRGLGIVPIENPESTYIWQQHENVIHYAGNNLPQVVKALEMVFYRKSGTPLQVS
jgi:hypothetical protein